MASFDITSLYTCIPLDETIDICTRSLIDEDGTFINLNSKELSTMLNFATKNSIFYFNKLLYEQTDGMAMGSWDHGKNMAPGPHSSHGTHRGPLSSHGTHRGSLSSHGTWWAIVSTSVLRASAKISLAVMSVGGQMPVIS